MSALVSTCFPPNSHKAGASPRASVECNQADAKPRDARYVSALTLLILCATAIAVVLAG